MQHLITLLKSDPSIPQDELQAILAGGASSKRLPFSAYDDSTGLLYYQTVQTSPASGKPLALQDLEFLSQSQVLKDFCISVFNSNFMGTFLKCYNHEAQQNIDLLYDAQNRHVHLVTSMKGDEVIYCGYDCINGFCEDVFASVERVRQTEWFIANFGSEFDFLPILEWPYKQHKYVPKVLLGGKKVVSMRVVNKQFIDFYLFIPIRSSKFPTTFNLKDLKKGYFPYFLTSKEALYFKAA